MEALVVLETRRVFVSNEALILRAERLCCGFEDPNPPKDELKSEAVSSEDEAELNSRDLERPLLLTADAFRLGGAVTEIRSEARMGDLESSLARMLISFPPSQAVSVVKRGKGVVELSR